MEDLGTISVNVVGGQGSGGGSIGSSSPGVLDRIREITAKILDGIKRGQQDTTKATQTSRRSEVQRESRLREISDSFRRGKENWKTILAAKARSTASGAMSAMRRYGSKGSGALAKAAAGTAKFVGYLGSAILKLLGVVARAAGPIGVAIGAGIAIYQRVDKSMTWMIERFDGVSAALMAVETRHKLEQWEQTRRFKKGLEETSAQWQEMKNKWSLAVDESLFTLAKIFEPFAKIIIPIATGVADFWGYVFRWDGGLLDDALDLGREYLLRMDKEEIRRRREEARQVQTDEYLESNDPFLMDFVMAGGSPRGGANLYAGGALARSKFILRSAEARIR